MFVVGVMSMVMLVVGTANSQNKKNKKKKQKQKQKNTNTKKHGTLSLREQAHSFTTFSKGKAVVVVDAWFKNGVDDADGDDDAGDSPWQWGGGECAFTCWF